MAKNGLFFLYCLLFSSVGVDAALRCYETGYFRANSTYGINRNLILSSLGSNVTALGGFYNASMGQDSNRVYALGLCRKGFKAEACLSCVNRVSRNLIKQCPNVTEAYSWDGDDNVSCLVRYSNRYTFGSLELEPVDSYPNPGDITTNLTLFDQEWEGLMRRTIAAASMGNSSRLRYYAVVRAAFTYFQNIYTLMQCTSDLSPSECNGCLRESVAYYQGLHHGKRGGEVARPSCYFRWDMYPFYGAFSNLTVSPSPPQTLFEPPPSDQRTNNTIQGGIRSISSRTIVIIVVSTVVNFSILVATAYALYQRRKPYPQVETAADSGRAHMLRFDLDTLRTATSDFSTEKKIGHGGFGVVYKGKLPNGQDIAVKRLSKESGQGETEFKNEVLLLARLQHRNLVKLLGFCLEGNEKLLIYEFVPNSSLDHLMFDPVKRSQLTWDMRYKIIDGIVRGLLYLHEDSQLRIIHRDLKTSNILLDADMNPKVSDFGMARLFSMDETRGVTSRVVGTYGYMAPEYIKLGQFSVKSDVYSFGVLVLEIITGKKNTSFEPQGLPSYAWKRWSEGKALEIIDPILKNYSASELMRCIHIALLCVQENVARRPTISSVVPWLSSGSTTLPIPAAAAFLINSASESYTSSSLLDRSATSDQSRGDAGAFSLNEASITELVPR